MEGKLVVAGSSIGFLDTVPADSGERPGGGRARRNFGSSHRKWPLLPREAVHKPLDITRGAASGTTNAKAVRTHGDEILRLATSIRQGTVTASLMLRKLGSYPRQNGLAVALRELGRIERSLFTLDWLQDIELRRRVQAGLNKGEDRNGAGTSASRSR